MRRMNQFGWVGVFAMAALATGCGSGLGGSGGSVALNLQNLGVNTGTVVTGLRDGVLQEWFRPGGVHSYATGFNTSSQLLSLKYILTDIELCQTVDATSAFGFGSRDGCSGLFTNNKVSQMTAAPDSYSISDILGIFNSPTDSFDLMSADDIARLNSQVGSVTAGDYNYVLVNWAPAIGVKGSVTVNGTTLNTHAQTSVNAAGHGYYAPQSVTSDMTVGTPDLTYVQSANGGSVFKFQKPQTISTSGSYKLDIILNPTGVLTGCTANTGSGNITDNTNSINMPMLPVTAVLRDASDTLMRESYPITVGSGSDITFRVDLYYLKSDSSKTIVAAQVAGLPTNTDSSCYNPDLRVFQVTTAADGSLTLATNTTGGNILTGLKRGDSASGTTVTFGNAGGTSVITLPGGATTGTEGAGTTTAYN